MITIDYKSRVPIYDQIIAGFIRLKALGVLAGGDKLPSVRSLALELGINPNTVQRAYTSLETQGVIYSVSGKGSFISDEDTAGLAVMQSAKNDFKKAVEQAISVGLTRDDLINIIKGGIADD